MLSSLRMLRPRNPLGTQCDVIACRRRISAAAAAFQEKKCSQACRRIPLRACALTEDLSKRLHLLRIEAAEEEFVVVAKQFPLLNLEAVAKRRSEERRVGKECRA